MTTELKSGTDSLELYDAIVVGAGPYGLSTAAHLLDRGLKVAIFGKPLGLWRQHMPQGMLLRSHWWATNLSDSGNRYGFGRFFREGRVPRCYPVPIELFIDYGLWFQRHAVPEVDETFVTSVELDNGAFLVTLEDGRRLKSRTVVMAIGCYYYASRPEPFNRLSSGFVSHSCDHRDFADFNRKTVIVIGGGQSAIESAALLHEAGAIVHVVTRRPIRWLAPDRADERSLIERIVAPNASIAPGWENWILEHLPYLFYKFAQERKDKYNSQYSSGGADWLRDRIIGKVTLHEGQTVLNMEVRGGQVDTTLSDGTKIRADHLLMATGYDVNIAKLPMLHPSLLANIGTDRGSPVLDHWFESSVPGLYFVGLTSLRAFGPLFRFVVGCRASARRVAKSIASSLNEHRLAASRSS